MKQPCVYIVTNRRQGVLYTGVTAFLPRRNFEHKNKILEGFAKRYNCTILVYCEFHEAIEAAILREKQIKKWKRDWKIELIEKLNPDWNDLSERLI
ncbi:MAG: GIY-YIG nuclease family protein [Pseudomonadota bacterium]